MIKKQSGRKTGTNMDVLLCSRHLYFFIIKHANWMRFRLNMKNISETEDTSLTKVKTGTTRPSRGTWVMIGGSLVLSVLAGVFSGIQANSILTFIVAGGALALLA